MAFLRQEVYCILMAPFFTTHKHKAGRPMQERLYYWYWPGGASHEHGMILYQVSWTWIQALKGPQCWYYWQEGLWITTITIIGAEICGAAVLVLLIGGFVKQKYYCYWCKILRVPQCLHYCREGLWNMPMAWHKHRDWWRYIQEFMW